MGLDMYLSARKWIGGYASLPQEEQSVYADIVEKLGAIGYVSPDTPSMTVSINVAYWRKANAIHNWFVNNVQEGEDNCQEAYVSREKLEELRKLCLELLLNKDPVEAKTFLTPTAGFFFGGTLIDEGYWKDLEDTADQLERVLKIPEEWSIHYQSSW